MIVGLRIGHMLCQCVQRFCRIRLDVFKGIRPALVIIKSFHIPCIVGHSKDRHLGCLRFLHGVCHNTFYVIHINICMEKASFSHQETPIVDIIYRPVEPEQRSAALLAACCIVPAEMIQRSLLHRFAHRLACPEDLDFFREARIVSVKL